MDIPEEGYKPNFVSTISPNGDIVLVVGPDNVRLRVQSHLLICASYVFDDLFKSHRAAEIRPENPMEVQLEDDDADAMREICNIIHFRNNDVSQSLTPKEILQIAIHAHKYDLNIVLKYVMLQWLQPKKKHDIADRGYLLAATFLFGDMNLFATRTWSLLVRYNGSYLDLSGDKITSKILPWKLFFLLEERRTQIRVELRKLLDDGAEFVGGCSSCNYGKDRSDKYKKIISKYGDLKMLEVPISEITDMMKMVSYDDMKSKPKHQQTCVHEPPTQEEMINGQLETMKKKFTICLDCVRKDDAATPCSFQHV